MEGKEEVKDKLDVPGLGKWVMVVHKENTGGESLVIEGFFFFFYVDFKGEVEGERDILHSYQIIKKTLVIDMVTKEP